jgi:hypothetical protein
MPDTDLVLVDIDDGIYKMEKPEYYNFKVGETYTATTRYSECQVEVIEMPEGGSATNVYFRPVGREGEILEKKKLKLPKKLVNIIHCKNPRCITSIEQGLDHVFYLSDPDSEIYRCVYCDEKYHSAKKRS